MLKHLRIDLVLLVFTVTSKVSKWGHSFWDFPVRDGLPKKLAVLSDFVQMRGEGPAQIFCPRFTNCIYWVNLGMGREGETPAQIFWHIGINKKVVKVVQIRGKGGGSR